MVETKTYPWDDLADEELLNLRISDLRLQMEGTEIEQHVQRLFEELDNKSIAFRPVCYLGDEWFTPEGITTIAIPFYLAHARLKRLEQKMMLEIEGGTEKEFMQLLRHEAGHSFCHAYRLRNTPTWRRIFGSPKKEYTTSGYRVRPYSRNYVRHLDNWYAQSHPEEDFAETFAVWLTPSIDWRKKYAKWKAIAKLEYVDSVAKKYGSRAPYVNCIDRDYDASVLRIKLKTHYRRKRKEYAEEYPEFYDPDLRKIFAGDTADKSRELASQFMRRYRKELVNSISRWSAEKKINVNMLVSSLLERCQELQLRLSNDETRTSLEVASYLATLITNHLFTGHFRKPV